MTGHIEATVRPYSVARRMPQWQRLIDTIHKAQAAAGYPGRQWGDAEIEFFGASAVGIPAEYVAYDRDPNKFKVYWVERQEVELSDGTLDVSYTLKMARMPNLANVDTIERVSEFNPTPEWEEATALAMVKRAHSQKREGRS